MRNLWKFLLVSGVIVFTNLSFAGVKSEKVDYRDGKTKLQGQLVYNDELKGPRPGIVVVHQWMGITDHELDHAKKLAERGYVVLVADIYGKDLLPKNTKEAGDFATKYKTDLKLFRSRETAAFEVLKKNKSVDSQKIVFIGYCFGGTGALEAARAGLPIVGAVSFHGGLKTAQPQDAAKIKAKILVLHGALDPYESAQEISGFYDEMNKAKVDYQFISYSGAVHAFTQKNAGSDISKGAAYNESAANRSWLALLQFLNEVAPVSTTPP